MNDLDKKIYKANIFNKGQSAKVFREICDNNELGLVIKNSEPYLVLIPYKKFEEIEIKLHDMELRASNGE